MDRDSDPPLVPVHIDGRDHMVRLGYAAERQEAQARQEAEPRRDAEPRRARRDRLEAFSCPGTSLSGRRPRSAKPSTAPRIRQSAMYSDRPRRSRGNRERAQPPASAPVEEEDHSDLPSHVAGPTISDTTKFETLSINDPDPALDSTYSDAGGDLRDTAIVEPSVTEDASSSWSEEAHEIEEYFKEHTYSSWEALCEFWYSSGNAIRPDPGADDDEAVSEQSSPERSDERPVLASEQGQQVPVEVGPHSKEKIADNGMKWMEEEVMVAFRKYFERRDDLKGCDYKFDKLRSQCFSVENYNHMFHHFNFTVKMKGAGSTDWTSVLYFAEVKEIFRRKIYFCSPLEEDENEQCYGCKNQGIDDLKHPTIGAYDRGSPDTVFPYMYDDSSDDEFAPAKLDDEADEE